MIKFFSKDPVPSRQEIIDELYQRLSDVQRSMRVKYPMDDEFENGINCRLANEQLWLEELLDKIERS